MKSALHITLAMLLLSIGINTSCAKETYFLAPHGFYENSNVAVYKKLINEFLGKEILFDDIENYKYHMDETNDFYSILPLPDQFHDLSKDGQLFSVIEVILNDVKQKPSLRFETGLFYFSTESSMSKKEKKYAAKNLVRISNTEYMKNNWNRFFEESDQWEKFIHNWSPTYFRLILGCARNEKSPMYFGVNPNVKSRICGSKGLILILPDSMKLATKMPVYMNPCILDSYLHMDKYPPVSKAEMEAILQKLPEGSAFLDDEAKTDSIFNLKNLKGTFVFKANDSGVYFVDIETAEIIGYAQKLGSTPDMLYYFKCLKKKKIVFQHKES